MKVHELAKVLAGLPRMADVRIDYLNNGEPIDSVGVECVRTVLFPPGLFGLGNARDVVMLSAKDERQEDEPPDGGTNLPTAVEILDGKAGAP